MSRLIIFLYGTVAYFVFFGTILYMIGFVGGFWVPKSLNSGVVGDPGRAILINVLLVLLFAVQHTIMARPSFKRWWTQFIPRSIERSTFVLVASLLLILMFWLWQPMAGTVWQVESAFGQYVLYGLFALGWLLVFWSSFLINHFDLFGLRQVYLHMKGKRYTPVQLKIVSLYRIVRNPLMLGFLIAFWSTPLMTTGHFVFAISMTAYILVGIQFEERNIVEQLGEEYRVYQENTPMILPVPVMKKKGACPFHFSTRKV